MRIIFCVACLISLSGFAAKPLYGQAPPGIPVKEISVEGLYSAGKDELLYLLDIESGRTLEPEKLRKGIKRAYLKGLFEDIAVEADDEGRVMVMVREKDILRRVVIRGNSMISDEFIRERLGLLDDAPVDVDLLEKALRSLRAAVADMGYPDAALSAALVKTAKPHRLDVSLGIEEGAPLLVKSIEVLGPQELIKMLDIGEGDVYDQFIIRKGIDEIRKTYVRRGYLKPEVGPYTFKDGTLFISVSPGDRLTVTFKGNSAIGARELRAALPFVEAGDVREDIVEEAVNNMVSLYHAKGYPAVQIAPVLSRKGNEVAAHFYVFEGDRMDVGFIRFSGVTIPVKNVKEILFLREGAAYNPEMLEPDAERVKEFYAALGYLDAEVYAPLVRIEGGEAIIEMEVAEGERFEIERVGIEGAKSIAVKEVLDAAKLNPGVPYNEVDISDARYRILSLYRSRGYAKCRADIERRFEGSKARVLFRIEEGPMLLFGKTVVIGNKATKLKVVERELVHEEGMPYDNTLLMKSRQRLYKLSLFSDVEIKTADPYDGTVDVEAQVKEGNPGAFEFGVGYGEYEQYRGFFDISYRNLLGLNKQVSFRTELSSLHNRLMLNYQEPWFLGRQIPYRVILMREERKEKNIDTGEIRYRLTRYTVSTGVQKKLGEKARFDFFYEFSITETFDVMPDVVLSREDTGTLAISSIIPSIAYDSRDNPFDPTKGVLTGLSLKIATDMLFSETDFLKLTVHGSDYLRLFRWLVLAASVRGGFAVGLRDTEELPLVERFFLGGRNTIRGFDQDSVGPLSSLGTPTGGDAFLQGNLELRSRVTGNWRLVGFLDAGNVWLETTEVNPLDLRYSAGVGIRYGTPVGPLRVDYGWKLDKRAEESPSELHFSIGHAF